MSQMTASTATKLRGGAEPKPSGLLSRLFAAWLRRRQMRRDEMWLLRQPDYLLRDIGIDRSEIEAIVRRGQRYR